MAQRDFPKAELADRIIQRAPAHLRAHRARVLFLPVVENDRADLRFLAEIAHTQVLAVPLDRRKIHAVKPHVDGDRRELKGRGVIASQRGEYGKERQRVLSARHADGDLVPRGNHMVIVDALSHQAHHFLHLSGLQMCNLRCEHSRDFQRIQENSRAYPARRLFFLKKRLTEFFACDIKYWRAQSTIVCARLRFVKNFYHRKHPLSNGGNKHDHYG